MRWPWHRDAQLASPSPLPSNQWWMWVGIQSCKAAPMRASVGHRAPMGERNEAGFPHLQQRRVSVAGRPTVCMIYVIGKTQFQT